MDKVDSAKIKIMISLLEKYSSKKVVLIEKENLEEVKRTKMTQPFQVKAYVEELLRKYKIRKYARVVLTGNYILVEDTTANPDLFNYRNVSFELFENGFKQQKTNKNINGKSFIQMKDSSTRIIVLLPNFNNK